MKSRLEWKVGLFVVVGLVLLAVLMLGFAKGLSFFQSSYTINLRAGNVGGLKPRSFVLMAGVQVGTVSEIRLAPDGKSVVMGLRIFGQYQDKIHKDARFVIEQSGFLGDQYVSILPTQNQGPVFTNGEEAQAEAPFNLQETARAAAGFIRRIDDTARRVNETIDDLRRNLLNQETLTNLATAAGNLRVASERALGAVNDIDLLVTTNRPALAMASTNLVYFSSQMNQFAGGLSQVLATNAPDIQNAVKNIETSSEVMKNLLSDVQAGNGSVGALLRDRQMAANLSEIAQNLSITTSNLNRLGLWGILWKQKLPKTNAPASSFKP